MDLRNYKRLLESYQQVHTSQSDRFEIICHALVDEGIAPNIGKAKVIAENLSDSFAQYLLSERPTYDIEDGSGRGSTTVTAKTKYGAKKAAQDRGYRMPKITKVSSQPSGMNANYDYDS
jgi:hypothetical protein